MEPSLILHSIGVEPSRVPHKDLPEKYGVFAQIIIEHNIFAQTVCFESGRTNYLRKEKKNVWKLVTDCVIPADVQFFSIAILREGPPTITRLLGTLDMTRNEVLSTVKRGNLGEVSFPIIKVNDDGPDLILHASFNVDYPKEGISIRPNNTQIPHHKTLYSQMFSLDHRTDLIQLYLQQMHEQATVNMHTYGEIDALEASTMYERILLLPSSQNSYRLKAELLSTLGDVYSKRHKSHVVNDLHRAANAYSDAVTEMRSNFDFEPAYWNDLVLSLRKRFEGTGDIVDINESVRVCEDALERVGNWGHHIQSKTGLLNNLGCSLLARFERLGNIFDLNRSIEVKEAALALMTEDDRNRPFLLTNLGNSLRNRFELEGDMSDLQRSIEVTEAVNIVEDGDPNKPSLLINMGSSLFSRFERLGDVSDLHRSIQVYEDAVRIIPIDYPHRHTLLTNLGSSLLTRFQRLGGIADLDRSIRVREDAVRIMPDGHPEKPSLLNDLASSLLSRCERLGDVPGLNRCISVFENAVKLLPNDHPDKPQFLNNLGTSLFRRFEQVGDLPDVERSIRIFEDVTNLTLDAHPDKSLRLNNLGIALLSRFERLGDIGDVDRSITALELAVKLTPDCHPRKAVLLDSLGNSLSARFERLGEVADVDRSIKVHKRSVDITPDGHPDIPSRCHNLGNALFHRFDRFGDVADVDMSIQVFEDAVRSTPDDHLHKATLFNGLGNSLFRRFEQLGDVADLKQCTQILEDAVQLTPAVDPGRHARLSNLGSSLGRRFEWSGDITDLNRSIKLLEEATKLTPDNHPEKAIRFNNLGNSLSHRFDRLGDVADLNRSVEAKENAVNLTPQGHPARPARLNNLGTSLRERFDRLGSAVDLDRSTEVFVEAVNLTPNGHPSKPSWLNNLGTSLEAQFKQTGHIEYLNRSVLVLEEATQLASDDHPFKFGFCNNLGNSLSCRFQQLGDIADVDKAIEVMRSAVDALSDAHPSKCVLLSTLGHSLVHRFSNSRDARDVDAAISCYSLSAKSFTGAVSMKFKAASLWMLLARCHAPEQALESCTFAMNLIPELTWLGCSINDRHLQVREAGRIAREAAAVAVAAEQYGLAVEWLEQGRSVIWNQLLQLRTPMDELHLVHPDLALRLSSLSSQLEGSTVRTDSGDPLVGRGATDVDYHNLAQERQELLGRIRRLEGFERFLLSKPLSELRRAAKKGPVVVLGISTQGCDALVLPQDCDDVLCVPLPAVSGDTVSRWSDDLRSVSAGRLPKTESPPGRLTDITVDLPDLRYLPTCARILTELWDCMVHPILDALNITTTMAGHADVRRIWWCPTGPLTFLPIHAAGAYPSGPKLTDFVVSSYTPTITALLDATRTEACIASQLLTVSLPNEAGLPGTQREIHRIAGHATIHVQNLCETAATPQSVLAAIEKCEWAHFACHGRQDSRDPTESCLLLANRSKLRLSDIIKLRLEKAQLAFLSACQTATGDRELGDEAVHLAAGMLMAGYREVVATMWSVDDQYAADVAEETYCCLFGEYGADSTNAKAAEALHFAVEKVRREREAKSGFSFSWIPFVHLGA